jgi:hypothetical protein
MAFPVDLNGADAHSTLESVAEDFMFDTKNFVKGNGFGSIKVSTDGVTYVDYPAAEPTLNATSLVSGNLFAPNLSKNLSYVITVDDDLEINLPTSFHIEGVRATIEIIQDSTGGHDVTMIATGQRYRPMLGTVGVNKAPNSRSLIEIFYVSGLSHYYRITHLSSGSAPVPPRSVGDLIPFEITITSAQVLAGNTTPITLVSAPGANRLAVLTELYEIANFNSVGYATNNGVLIQYSGGDPIVSTDIGFNTNIRRQWQLGNAVIVGFTSLAENEAIMWKVDNGNPTAGNSDIRYIGFYRIIDLS